MSATPAPGPAPGPEHVTLDGVTIAPGVVETIVVLAAEQTEGVAGVACRSSLRRMSNVPDVDVELIDDELTCSVHLVAEYGSVLPELGKAVQTSIASALDGQMGIRPARVDVFIDAIEF